MSATARVSALNIPSIPMQLLTPESLKLLTFPYGLKPPIPARSYVFHVYSMLTEEGPINILFSNSSCRGLTEAAMETPLPSDGLCL